MFKQKATLATAIATIMLLSTQVYAADTAKVETEETTDYEEVVVLGTRKALFTEITENAEKLVDMPGALGDPLGAITALPGVITPTDGGAPAVRGSSPEDNRYYIDSIPAGYIFHQFNTSIFDENVVQDFQLFSAGFGAQYSGATGAVFDVRLRDPKNIDFQTTINASLLRAGVFMEGGVTENSAFYLSARMGLIQFFIPEEDEANDEGFRMISAPEDSDYQAKYVWDINSNNKLSILLAGATDFAEAEITSAASFVRENPDFAGDAMIKDSFNSQGVTWAQDLNSGGESVLSVANYIKTERLEWGDNYYVESELDNAVVRGHITIPVGQDHAITMGLEHNDYTFDYNARTVLFVCTGFNLDGCQDARGEVIEDGRVLALKDTSFYLIDNWQVTDDLNIETGIQWNNHKTDYIDEDSVNPRIAAEWQAWDSVAITSSAGRYNRLPDIETILPILGNPYLLAPKADHFTLGLKGELGLNWNWSTEIYHKNLSNLPLALDDDEQAAEKKLYSNDVEGTAQGFDLFLNRNLADNWYGWVSLSYSHSERTNTRTNDTRDYYLDTPLVVNVVGNYQFSEKWDMGFRLTTKSGQATTEIIGIKPNPHFPGEYLPKYSEDAYGDRLPIYAQLDLRANRKLEWFGHEGSFYIDILNALNRENVVSRGLDYAKVNETDKLHLEDEVSMGAFPSIGVSFTF